MYEISDQYEEIGHVEQLHGVHGEVEVVLNHGIEAAGQLTDNTLVYLQLKSGDVIPARVSQRRIADKPDHESLFVLFDHSKSREVAAELIGAYVLIEKQEWEPGAPKDQDLQSVEGENEKPDIKKFIDFDAVDSEGSAIGKVLDAEEFPAQSMLLVELNSTYISSQNGDEKGKKQQIMVPLVDEYVENINESKGKIVLKNIERLILADEK